MFFTTSTCKQTNTLKAILAMLYIIIGKMKKTLYQQYINSVLHILLRNKNHIYIWYYIKIQREIKQRLCNPPEAEAARLASSTRAARADEIPAGTRHVSNVEQSIQSFRSSSCPHMSGIQTLPATSLRCFFSFSLPVSTLSSSWFCFGVSSGKAWSSFLSVTEEASLGELGSCWVWSEGGWDGTIGWAIGDVVSSMFIMVEQKWSRFRFLGEAKVFFWRKMCVFVFEIRCW